MSIWEQRANQLRRQNRASCEALYCELDLEERLRPSSAIHIRPDMITHLDRPLVIEPRDQPFLGSQYQNHNPSMPEEAGTDVYLSPPPALHQHCRHHHHRDRDQAKARNELNDNGNTSKEGGHHVHHSHSKEGKNERSRSQETSRRHHHHHHSSVDDNGNGGITKEKEHRHHHSYRQPRGGIGTVNDRRRAERRTYHKDGRSSNRDGEKNYRGESGVSGDRKRHRPHGSRGHSTAEGEESNKKEKTPRHR